MLSLSHSFSFSSQNIIFIARIVTENQNNGLIRVMTMMGTAKYVGIVGIVGAVTGVAIHFVLKKWKAHRLRVVVQQRQSVAGHSLFPDDVLFEIMLRLPLASVTRLSAVSKQFHRIAQRPEFWISAYSELRSSLAADDHMNCIWCAAVAWARSLLRPLFRLPAAIVPPRVGTVIELSATIGLSLFFGIGFVFSKQRVGAMPLVAGFLLGLAMPTTHVGGFPRARQPVVQLGIAALLATLGLVVRRYNPTASPTTPFMLFGSALLSILALPSTQRALAPCAAQLEAWLRAHNPLSRLPRPSIQNRALRLAAAVAVVLPLVALVCWRLFPVATVVLVLCMVAILFDYFGSVPLISRGHNQLMITAILACYERLVYYTTLADRTLLDPYVLEMAVGVAASIAIQFRVASRDVALPMLAVELAVFAVGSAPVRALLTALWTVGLLAPFSRWPVARLRLRPCLASLLPAPPTVEQQLAVTWQPDRLVALAHMHPDALQAVTRRALAEQRAWQRGAVLADVIPCHLRPSTEQPVVFYGRYLVANHTVWDLHRGGAFVGETEPGTCRRDAASFMGGRVLVFGDRPGVLDLSRCGLDGRLRFTDLGTLPAGGWRIALTGCHSDTPLLVLVSRVVHDELEIAEWDPDRHMIVRSAVVPAALQTIRASPALRGGTFAYHFIYAATARAILLQDPQGMIVGAMSRDRFELLWTQRTALVSLHARVSGNVVQAIDTARGGTVLFDVLAGCVVAQTALWIDALGAAPMFGGALTATLFPAGDLVVMASESQRRAFAVPVITGGPCPEFTMSYGRACVAAVTPSPRVESMTLSAPTCPLRGRAVVIRVDPDAL
jgi:hypothetical protein